MLGKKTYATIQPQGGHTKIKVRAHWGEQAFTIYLITGLVGFLATLGISALIDPASGAGVGALVAGGIGGTCLTARTLWQYVARKTESKLRKLSERFDEMGSTAQASETNAQVEAEQQAHPQQPDETTSQRPRIPPSQRI